MDLIDLLLGEHGAFHLWFAETEAAVVEATTVGEVKRFANMIRTALLEHALLEDELLLPALSATL